MGRENLEALYKTFSKEGYHLRLRRSPKLKLLSQFMISLPCEDTMFPVEACAVLRKICDQMNVEWPTRYNIGYPVHLINRELPSHFRINHPNFQKGYNLGQLLGQTVKKLKIF